MLLDRISLIFHIAEMIACVALIIYAARNLKK